ncbi:MAG: lipid A biosynthesis acyltransferase [Candidatus Thioglobus sp.]|jgi:lipid A biosynthesis lauroyl/palmitoleoyl acyltransferase|nr:lipid A biosynthesis acyltransferase [Candidatus Thioglobus sp.]MBT4422195.1 lipid A biosynthesis acyltransferase [Candidatus Thioglobus sp.]MBT4746761.1 lipid A biosynthesis acyltransferase [Candidatus Thioglobus sp.]MBT5164351.1 lipid A biosynthesis acyltransferase [Candidatus Thioglobus sp.]MBT6022082.1 lipid A biosynthesis acyltransferase [Candidatus Thioglobus sp.]
MNNRQFYHPKFLPTWLLISLMKFGAKLPFKVQVTLGKIMGMALYPLLGRFRKIAFINISRCFPNKRKSEVEALVRQNFEALGVSIFETANAYFATNDKVSSMLSVHNEHHLTTAINNQQSVILLAAHFMPLMLGSRALLLKYHIANIYRPQNNALFDETMRKGFVDNGATMIKTKDTKSMLKAIKNKLPIWYAPDQDLGLDKCIFAPFFGIQTATVSATARLAKGENTVVIPYFFIRTDSGYSMSFEAPIENYPNTDAAISATITNQILEAQILKFPEQYLWIHKRFKTRPEGEQDFY